MNTDTATSQQLLNMTNQVTPDGSLTYTQTGTNGYTDSQGNWVELPQFTATTTLSPQQQAIKTQTDRASYNLANIANQQSGFLVDYLGKPVDTSGAPALQTSSGLKTSLGSDYKTSLGPNWSSSLGSDYKTSYAGANDFSKDRAMYTDALLQRMAPGQQQDQDALRTQLINSGIRPGTAAWDAEWNRNQQGVNDARLAAILAGGDEQARMVGMSRDAADFTNKSLLDRATFGNNAALSSAMFGNDAALKQFGAENDAALSDATFNNNARSQYLNEAYAERMQPLSEIGYLMGLGTAQSPQFTSTPQTGVAGVDYTGLVNQQYQAELQQSQAAMGGLFGLLAAPFSMFSASDERVKTDKVRVGTTFSGIPIYSYRYVWGGPYQLGVMAQDVEGKIPEAVAEHPSGIKMVDYSKVN